MTSIDIYSILSSKPHNEHYLKRYWKFIIQCQRSTLSTEYTEDHHICPKSKNLFPEFGQFRQHPWNKITLTYRQHFIAHWILSKAYGKCQAKSFAYMCHQDNRGLRPSIRINQKQFSLAKIKNQEVRKSEKCNTYYDEYGNQYWVRKDHPDVVQGKLIHFMTGRKDSDATKLKKKNRQLQRYKHMQDEEKAIKDRNISNAKKGKLFSDDHKTALSIAQKGKKHQRETIEKRTLANKGKKRSKEFAKSVSERLEGMLCVKDYNNNCFFIKRTDPRFLSGELIGNRQNPKTYIDSSGVEHLVLRNHPNVLTGEWKLI